MTRWLSPREQVAWRSFRRATRMLEVWLDAEMQALLGVPASHYMILAMLSEAEGSQLRMRELAAATQSSRSRLSHAIAGLEARGWVERRACATDRRGQVAVLTRAGRQAIEAAAPAHVENVRMAVFDHLDRRDIDDLARISRKIVAALNDEFCRGERGRCYPQPD